MKILHFQSEFFSHLMSSTCSVCSYLPHHQLTKLLHNVLLVLRAAPPSPHLLVHAVRLLGRLVEYTGEADISAGRGDGRLLAEMAALYRLALVQSASHAPVMMEGLKVSRPHWNRLCPGLKEVLVLDQKIIFYLGVLLVCSQHQPRGRVGRLCG